MMLRNSDKTISDSIALRKVDTKMYGDAAVNILNGNIKSKHR